MLDERDCVEDGVSVEGPCGQRKDQSRLVLAGRYHDGSEKPRILSDVDTKSLPDLPLDRPAKADIRRITIRKVQTKHYLAEHPSSRRRAGSTPRQMQLLERLMYR